MAVANGVARDRKFKIASRMLWMTFSLTIAMLAVAWASNDEQGETIRAAISAIASMWPWFVIALGGWFGITNAAVHKFKSENGNGQ